MRKSTINIIAIASSALIALIAVLLISGMLWTDLRIPYEYQYDALSAEAGIKGLIDNGWIIRNPDLGAPAGQVLYDFPSLELLDNLLLKMLAVPFRNFAVTINLFYILTFPLAAAAAAYACMRIGLRPITSAVVGILYAFAPCHFLRFEKHLFVSAYFTAPLSLLLLYGICREKATILGGPVRNILLAVVTGVSGLYYCVMGCMLIVAASLVASLDKKRVAIFFNALAFCSIAGAVMLSVASPSIAYWLHHGMPRAFARQPDDVERFGLTLSQMILPVPHHRIAQFDDVRRTFNATMLRDIVTENETATLGLAATIGFFILVAAPFIRPLRQTIRRRMVLSYAALIALFWAMIGGFSATFSLLPLASIIRSTNRISIFIAFYSLCGLGALADSFIRRRRAAGGKPAIVNACYIAVVAIALFDQCPAAFNVPDKQVVARFNSDEQLGRYIDASLPPGSMIFNLPYEPFPEGVSTGVGDYDEFRPYLHTHHVRYSYGAMRGRGDVDWQQSLLSSGPDCAPALRRLGFGAILIDLNYIGQSAGARAQVAQIVKACHASPAISADGSFLFVPIH